MNNSEAIPNGPFHNHNEINGYECVTYFLENTIRDSYKM